MPTKIIKIATSHKNFLDWKNGCVLQTTILSKGNGRGGEEGAEEWKGEGVLLKIFIFGGN